MCDEFLAGAVKKEVSNLMMYNNLGPNGCSISHAARESFQSAALVSWPIIVTDYIDSRTEITCEEPLLTVDKQMGLNIVHPEGKVCPTISRLNFYQFYQPAKTVFKRLFYDKVTDTSVLHCKP
jgi:hypothetical protein